MTKQMIRSMMKDLRQDLDPSRIELESKGCFEQLIQTDIYKESTVICTYISHDKEIDTRYLIDQVRKTDKKLAAPRVDGDLMDMYYFDDVKELKEGAFHILEPQGSHIVDTHDKVLVIVPGLCFDESCHRIGYGGGYYDKYLELHQEVKTIALAYEFQVLTDIPSEEFDYRPDMVITSKRIIRNED